MEIPEVIRKENDTRPLYVLVYDQLFNLIRNGYFHKGEQLPNENVLAQRLGVSRGTLRQALLILQEDGIISVIHGKGNFVVADEKNIGDGLEKLSNPARNFNIKDYTDVQIKILYEIPNDMLQNILQVNSNNLLISAHIIYKMGKENTCYNLAIVPYDQMVINNIDITNKQSLLNYFEYTVYEKATVSHSVIKLTTVGDYIAKKLKISIGENVFLIEDVLYNNIGEPILFSKSYMRPDFYYFDINRR